MQSTQTELASSAHPAISRAIIVSSLMFTTNTHADMLL